MSSRTSSRRSPARPARARRLLALLAVGVPLALAPSASAAVQDFPLPTADAGLSDIATGPDGSVWFSEKNGGKVGRITMAGQLSEWTVPMDSEYGPEELTVAADGRIWVLSDAHAKIFVIDPAVPGTAVSGYDVPGGRRGDDIATAPDGSIWITDSLGEGITRIQGTQVATLAGGPPDCSYDGILAPGPDGKMWCAFSGDALKRIEPNAVDAVNLPLPSGFSVGALAAGRDGAMWYGRYSAGSYAFSPGDGKVGRMTPDGAVQEWPVGDKVAPASLAAGPDGAMWFGSIGGGDGVLGRVTTAGEVTVAPLGVRHADRITFGGDGALWFTDANANRLTRITTDEVVKPPPVGGGGTGTGTGTGTGGGTTGAAVKPAVPAGSLRVVKGRVALRVSCPKTSTARCRGTVRLRTASKVRIGGKGSKAVRTVSATGRYTLSPGKTGTIRVKLSSTGRKVVRKGRTTKVSVQVTPTGSKSVVAKRTVSLRG